MPPSVAERSYAARRAHSAVPGQAVPSEQRQRRLSHDGARAGSDESRWDRALPSLRRGGGGGSGRAGRGCVFRRTETRAWRVPRGEVPRGDHLLRYLTSERPLASCPRRRSARPVGANRAGMDAADWTGRQALVIDNGTGYTKMGHAGNPEPSFVIPTAIAAADDGTGRDGVSDLDFLVGDAVRAVCRAVGEAGVMCARYRAAAPRPPRCVRGTSTTPLAIHRHTAGRRQQGNAGELPHPSWSH